MVIIGFETQGIEKDLTCKENKNKRWCSNLLDNIKFREYSSKYIKAVKYTLDKIDLN